MIFSSLNLNDVFDKNTLYLENHILEGIIGLIIVLCKIISHIIHFQTIQKYRYSFPDDSFVFLMSN